MNGNNDLKFGDRVRIRHKLVRRAVHTPSWEKRWVPVEVEEEGIFIGKRTLSNGHVNCSFEEPAYYEPKEHFPAALVALERRNPVYVLFDALEREADDA